MIIDGGLGDKRRAAEAKANAARRRRAMRTNDDALVLALHVAGNKLATNEAVRRGLIKKG